PHVTMQLMSHARQLRQIGRSKDSRPNAMVPSPSMGAQNRAPSQHETDGSDELAPAWPPYDARQSTAVLSPRAIDLALHRVLPASMCESPAPRGATMTVAAGY